MNARPQTFHPELSAFLASHDRLLVLTEPAGPAAYTDPTGFWRLPGTSEAERERPFSIDRDLLTWLGTGKRVGPAARAAFNNLMPDRTAVLHFYQPSALILGKLDTRLPELDRSMHWLTENEVPSILRIAGGQAIVSDSRVQNLSLLFPRPGEQRFDYDRGFRLMASLIQAGWIRTLERLFPDHRGDFPADWRLKVEEVPASYCPGDYDLTLLGRKIGGIAQRRVKGAIGVMAYLSVGGDQDARAELVRDFYRTGQADERFPASDPAVMGTLDALLRQLCSPHKDNIRSGSIDPMGLGQVNAGGGIFPVNFVSPEAVRAGLTSVFSSLELVSLD